MKHRIFTGIVLVMVPFFLLGTASDAAAGMSKKTMIGIGAGLVVGGIVVGARAVSDLFTASDAELVVALAMIGAGTTMVILGATKKDDAEKEILRLHDRTVTRKKMDFSFGAGFSKRGWAVGVNIKW